MLAIVPDGPVLAAYALTCVILVITPGPDMSLFLSKTLSGGRCHGMAAMLGSHAGILVHTSLAAVGLSAVLAASDAAFTALKVVGAFYLGWMAYDAVRNGSSLALKAGSEPGQRLIRSVLTGILINLTNPKIVLFFVSFLPQFISVSDPHAAGKLAFLGLFYIAVSLPITALLVIGAERLVGGLKARPRLLRGIDYLFGGVFAAFAVKILMTQSAVR